MTSPPSGQTYPPPGYPQGPVYYPPMNIEGFLTKKMIWAANAVGLILVYLGFLMWLAGIRDAAVIGFERFLVFTGGFLGAAASVTGALGSKKTTDTQNLGLFVWAGFFLLIALFAVVLLI